MPNYQVIVGNIGTVYDGPDREQAEVNFADYQEMSEDGYGRAAGEPVTLYEDGEPIQEHDGDGEE